MKIIPAVFSAFFLLAPAVSAQTVPDVAKEVLTAYKNKDLEGVKKYTAPMMAAFMDAKFFEDKEVKTAVEDLQSWNGKVKEVRYYNSKIGVMASAYYADADKETFRALSLINAGYGWKQMGVSTVKKKKFLSYEKNEPKMKAGSKAEAGDKPGKGALAGAALQDKLGALGFGKKKSAAQTAPADDKAPAKGYSVEMADGTTAEAPSAEQLKKHLASLNSDNFFLTLTGPDGFLQASYTAKGLDMEYKDLAGHFASVAAVPAETAGTIFTGYLRNEDGWKSKCEWKPFK